MLTWRGLGLVLVVCLGSWGCEPPKAIVSSAAPGTTPIRKLPASEKEPAEALGEQAKATPTKAGQTGAPAPDPTIVPAPPTAKGETKTTPSGVKYETLVEGTGAEAKPGQTVTLHYTGTFEDGKKFDSSRDAGKAPMTFTIGRREVIRGWEEGVPGMKVGERRKLTIPASAGYGVDGKGPIPPNATLLFDVELLEIK